MADKRLGRQTPTTSRILPYDQTKGQEAIALYNKTGRTAQEWQELMMYDILAFDEEGLWVHSKFGYSIPRRNGKNEIVAIRELYGLMQGEHILHTAHRTTTSHAAWERLCNLLAMTGLEEKEDYKTWKQFGLETIEVPSTGGKVSFRTRTSKGGLGEGFDLLVIDEAQEYQDDQETALKYVVSDSANPQTLFCGTPPTAVSTGTVFTKLRKVTLEGGNKNAGWAEWSVEHMSDCRDVDLWYECNPSMGTILTERKVEDEVGTDEVDFNIQRLGLWIKYNQASAISQTEWANLKANKRPKLKGKLFVGIKYGHDGERVAMSVACKTEEDKIFVECIDCQSVRNGNDWILKFVSTCDIEKIVVDGASGQTILVNKMRDEKIRNYILPTVKEVIEANSMFEQGLFQKVIQHFDQPSLTMAVTNTEKRAIGSNGGFGYRCSKKDVESALVDSMIFAYWACSKKKEKAKQKVSY